MSLRYQDFSQVPADTYELAHKVFRKKGHPYLTLRDRLGVIYQDEQFAPLFASWRGRPAESPGRLAIVTGLQFIEDLDDRSAADQVRSRIDWKYLLGLALDDEGFDYSVLSEYRQRVIAGGQEGRLLTALLAEIRAAGLLKERGRQRSDSTHVLAAVSQLNRLECVGESLRHALNVIATVVPAWLQERTPPSWYERYGDRIAQGRLPHSEKERQALAERIGQDGRQLLAWCYAEDAPEWLAELPAVATLRQLWLQQYYLEGDQLRWRGEEEMPPHSQRIVSPYDVQARYSTKRQTHWTGYKVHLTETIDEQVPHLIVNVETTLATTPDHAVTALIHEHLADQDCLPGEHLVDAGYVDADELVKARENHRVELVGPVANDHSWQARTEGGYTAALFVIDWLDQQVTCPQGQTTRAWSVSRDRQGADVIHVTFPKRACQACAARQHCTKGQQRTLTFRPQAQHLALQARRQEQQSAAFQQKYKARAGIEGTVSLGTHHHGLRRSRYVGLTKTHLQHVATAVAINLMRLADWFTATPLAATRCSRFAALASV